MYFPPALSIIFAASLTLLAGCTTPKEKEDRAYQAARSNVDATLAGEWVSPRNADDYLMFKPDPVEPRTGRFSGIGDFDRYQVTSRLTFGGRINLKLLSATSDTDTPSIPVQVTFGPDYQTLTLTRPGVGVAQPPVVGTYRKERRQ